jgi:hypothetical protein
MIAHAKYERYFRWAEALAAAQLENGDAPDPDAEVSGEEFVGREGECKPACSV